MAEWLVEEGIGEHRAVRIEHGRIADTRIEWPGKLAAGWVIEAKLTARASGSPRGTAIAASGEEILVARLPREASEGATLRLATTRAALAGPGRLKRAQGRPSDAPLARPGLVDRLRSSGSEAKLVRRLPDCDWDDLIGEALAGEVSFAGGTLLLAPTPAMTTIDIDGDLPPRALALAAVPALSDALARLAVGGSVAIDFPTLADKADRRAVDSALELALSDWPHERTAMNGFGLIQIVARAEGPSLLQLAAWRRRGMVWRALLRRAEALVGPGTIALTLSAALEPEAQPEHIAELERRSGRPVRIGFDPALALEAPHAQLVAHG